MRGTAARFVISALTVLLFALHLPTPAATLSTAPSAAAPAAAAPSAPSVQPHETGEGESVTCGASGRHGDPNSLLRLRDRHRAAAGATCKEPARASGVRVDEVLYPPTAIAPPGHAHGVPRSASGPDTAALQVFRC